jgi:hypothetical protein
VRPLSRPHGYVRQSALLAVRQPLFVSSGKAPRCMSIYRDIAVRAVKTAVQSGLAIVAATGAGWVDADVWKAAGIAAVAAGLSALQNALTAQFQSETDA